MEQPSLFDTPPVLLTIPEAARLLSIGRTLTYETSLEVSFEVVHINSAARSLSARCTSSFNSVAAGDLPSQRTGSVRSWRRSDDSPHPAVRSATKSAGARHPGNGGRPGASPLGKQSVQAQTEAAQSHGVVFDPAGGKIPFRTYAEQWLEGRPLAETTHDNYAETLERRVPDLWRHSDRKAHT
ncbi:MAG: hypothetical protein R2714_02850 [Microthrixaceae bacterium]